MLELWPYGLIILSILFGFWALIKIEDQRRMAKEKGLEEEENRIKAIFQSYVEKYGDEKIAQDIMDGEIWKEMSEEMLIDSFGDPESIDEKVTARGVKKTLKYNQVGKNRFDTKIMLVDGIVTGWDIKNH